MYLEIGPRRTGKTSRLVRAVREFISVDKQVALIFPHNRAWQQAQFPDQRGNRQLEFMYSNKQFNDYLQGCDRSKHYRVFVDEFDFMQDYPIDIDGYYATTPKRQRTLTDMANFILGENDDKMLELIRFNNGHYEQYSPMQWLGQMTLNEVKSLRRNYNYEGFEMEFFGNVFK